MPSDLGEEGRREALAKNREALAIKESKILADIRKVRDDNDKALLDSILKERDTQIQAWAQETRFLTDQLQQRLKLRQDFEAQLGQGGLGREGVAAGFAAVRDLRNQLTKDLRDLAFLDREGLPGLDIGAEQTAILQQFVNRIDEVRARFAGLPSVIDLVDRELEPLHINFAAVSGEFEKARGFIGAFVPTAEELRTRLGGIAQAFATMPQTTDQAAQAIRELSRDYNDLSNAIFGATLQLFQFNQAAAG
jgi:methyl-accepting chemotaxis protein